MKVTVHLTMCDDDGHEGHYQLVRVLYEYAIIVA
jgi:hypothetical protein